MLKNVVTLPPNSETAVIVYPPGLLIFRFGKVAIPDASVTAEGTFRQILVAGDDSQGAGGGDAGDDAGLHWGLRSLMPGRTELVVNRVLGRGCDNLLSGRHGHESRRAG